VLDLIRPPWSERQVATLNRLQASGLMHPFTCGAAHLLHQTLIAETDGWHCPDCHVPFGARHDRGCSHDRHRDVWGGR
jgi:hypothetical protein